MARDKSYYEAEKKIEEARRSGTTRLDLSGMKLTELPETISLLTNLKELELGRDRLKNETENNQLTTLPESLRPLTQLNSLNLSGNQLTTLPDWFDQFTNLQVLDLSNNQLTALQESVGHCTQLQFLGLEGNQITVLPNSIQELKNLTSLYIGLNGIGNPIKQVQIDLRSLIKLETLALSNCGLVSVPDWISELRNLEDILVDGNNISDIPASLALLERLTQLELDDNPLNPELGEAYEQGLEAVKAYLRAKAEGEIVLNEAKLILVGEGGVGKTSLLAALRGEEWVENRETTHGVEVDITSLRVKDPDSSKEITLNGWDFGGQNIYRHTHQLFFTAPAVYLAVWEPRRGPEQSHVTEWIKMVKHRAYDESRPDERPRILVVATHGGPKERLDHIDEQAIRDEFGELICGFYHVDSKPDENGIYYQLDQLKEAIGR